MSRSSSFTISDARQVASSVGADLRNLYSKYGKPEPDQIADFVEEISLYLAAGHLNFVQFGFRDGDRWVLKLEYTAIAGNLLRNDSAGNLPSSMAVLGYGFHSYLEHNSDYYELTQAERDAFKATLPISRTPGTAPTANRAASTSGTQFSRNGRGLDRSVYLDV